MTLAEETQAHRATLSGMTVYVHVHACVHTVMIRVRRVGVGTTA